MQSKYTHGRAYHCSFKAASDRISLTRYAPWQGGLEYIAREMPWICDFTLTASLALSQTTDSAPIRWPYMPMFFAYDWDSAMGKPWPRKSSTACLSRTQSPDANPWYAISKKEKWLFSRTTVAISFHCSGVGSTPVGLCAHAWNMMTEPEGALCVSATMSVKRLKTQNSLKRRFWNREILIETHPLANLTIGC